MASSKSLFNKCCIAELTIFRERIVMPLWRSISSVNLMLPKEERK